jgi:translation initiation factor IF-1
LSTADLIETTAVVVECLPNCNYLCRLPAGQIVRAYSTGNMKRFKIACTVGDDVLVQVSPYSIEIGRLVRRL